MSTVQSWSCSSSHVKMLHLAGVQALQIWLHDVASIILLNWVWYTDFALYSPVAVHFHFIISSIPSQSWGLVHTNMHHIVDYSSNKTVAGVKRQSGSDRQRLARGTQTGKPGKSSHYILNFVVEFHSPPSTVDGAWGSSPGDRAGPPLPVRPGTQGENLSSLCVESSREW